MALNTRQSRIGPEIQRMIFIEAAYASVYTASRLVLVAKRVLSWVEPILYRIVVIHKDMKWPPIKALNVRSPEDLLKTIQKHGKHVRHLLLDDTPNINANVLQQCLKLCPNVVDLALLTHKTDPSIMKICLRMKLTRLSIRLSRCIGYINQKRAAGIARRANAVGKNNRRQKQVPRRNKVDVGVWPSMLTHIDILDDSIHWDKWAQVFWSLKNVKYMSLKAHLEDDPELEFGIIVGCDGLKRLIYVGSMQEYRDEEGLDEDDEDSDESDEEESDEYGDREGHDREGDEHDHGKDSEEERDDDADVYERYRYQPKPKKKPAPPSDPAKREEELLEKETFHIEELYSAFDDQGHMKAFCKFEEDWLKGALGGTDLWG